MLVTVAITLDIKEQPCKLEKIFEAFQHRAMSKVIDFCN